MISVIVITYNRARALKVCIESLLKQNYKPYEIIIIDDGSTDHIKQLVKKIRKKHKVIKYFWWENKGVGAARNLGLKKARGDIILFTDDDCIAPQDWMENIKNIFEKYPNIAATGGSIINVAKNRFGEATHILNFSSWLPSGKKKYVKDIPTANIAYKKQYIKKLFFPETPKNVGYEDSIFNHNLIKRGGKILFDPSIKVCHNPNIRNYDSFLRNQSKIAVSFLLRGYKVHGVIGKLLIKLRFINLFCPRLLLVFLRCLRSPKNFCKFIVYFPLILRGELERGLTINLNKPRYL